MKRKLIACLAAACALCTAAALFAGCNDKGPEKDPDDGKEPGGTPSETTIEWQFTGDYHELLNNGFDFYFLGNMMSDGSGIIYHAQWFNGDVTYTEIELEWESATDRDGLTTFSASTDDSSASFTEVSIYAESDGTFNWEYKFQFMGGYSRTIDFVGTENPEYDSVDEWKAFVEENAGASGTDTPEEPEKEAILTFAGGEGNSIEFYADKTARIMAYGGAIDFEYTWDVADGVITMTSVGDPDEKITSTTADGVTTIVYAASLGGNQVNLTFTCADISALEGVEAKEELVTFTGENGSIVFYSDNTAFIQAFGGAINFEYTWELADGVITMTSVGNPSEKITSTTADGVTTIVYAASLGGNQVNLTFTCADISALG